MMQSMIRPINNPSKGAFAEINRAYNEIINTPQPEVPGSGSPGKQNPEPPHEIILPYKKEDCILLPAEFYADNTYPNLLFPKRRLSLENLTEQMKAEALELNLTLQNNDQGFIGDISWTQAMQLIQSLIPLNSILYFNKALSLLCKGIEDPKFKIYNGSGNLISLEERKLIFNDITEQKKPYRAELLHVEFKEQGEKLYITTPRIQSDGKVIIQEEELNKNTLMEDKTPGISLEDWLKSPTPQGLPRKKINSGALSYWFPRNNTVARFDADSVRVGLLCDVGRGYSVPGLGLRPILTAEGDSQKQEVI